MLSPFPPSLSLVSLLIEALMPLHYLLTHACQVSVSTILAFGILGLQVCASRERASIKGITWCFQAFLRHTYSLGVLALCSVLPLSPSLLLRLPLPHRARGGAGRRGRGKMICGGIFMKRFHGHNSFLCVYGWTESPSKYTLA
jgi:hypothetical protein